MPITCETVYSFVVKLMNWLLLLIVISIDEDKVINSYSSSGGVNKQQQKLG